MTARVVFDTNILFSAVGWGGKPGRCVELAESGVIQGLTCGEIMEELAEKLEGRLGLERDETDRVIGSMLSFLDVVSISGLFRGPQVDRDDDKVIECAMVGKATHIVTGDRKHLLPLGRIESVELVTAAEMVQQVERTG
jgi:uncharacterized protein